MSPVAIESIEALLIRVRGCEERCRADEALMRRLSALRTWQARRLARTYKDLHRDPGYRRAVEFFLSDVYGAVEISARDQAFVRAWPVLRRLMPANALELLASVLELHVLTLELDSATARALPEDKITAASYLAGYRAADDALQRARQIDLIIGIGEQLTRFVRRAWVKPALRATHMPAHAGGFGALQSFLERGYQAFRTLSDTRVLLETIRTRETRLMTAMFGAADAPALDLLQEHAEAGDG